MKKQNNKIISVAYLTFILGIFYASKYVPKPVNPEPNTLWDIINAIIFVISIWFAGYFYNKEERI